MGASYYAYAVIGVEVTGKLYTVTKEPSCEHRPSGSFCSTCGKPNKTVEVKMPIAGYDEDRCTLGNLSVVHTTDQQKSFCGIAVKTGDLNYANENHKRLALAPYDPGRRDGVVMHPPITGRGFTPGCPCADCVERQEARGANIDELREKLTELGLWDEASFGLWAVGYCSY